METLYHLISRLHSSNKQITGKNMKYTFLVLQKVEKGVKITISISYHFFLLKRNAIKFILCFRSSLFCHSWSLAARLSSLLTGLP